VVGVLISMKLRVLRHSLRGAHGAMFGFGAFCGLVAALVCTALIGFHPGDIRVGADIASALFAVWTLGWLFGPVLTGGGDETLRPENFALLPIRPAHLAFGLLGAATAGIAPVATLLAFCGLVITAIPLGIVTVLVAALAVVLQLALAILLSRVLVAALGALLGSRRGKDLGVLLAALAGLSYLPAKYAFEALGPIVVGQTAPAFTAALRYLPSGWGPTAVVAAAARDWPPVLGWLLALAVLDGLLVLAWSRLLVRRLTVRSSAVGPRRSVAAGARVRRGPLPDSPLGAVVGKELRLWWRDARRRALLLTSILVGAILPLSSTAFSASSFAYLALWIVLFAALQVGNLYGLDGSAVWQTVVTPGAAHVDVRGRQWAWLLVVGPVALLAAAVAPALAGSPGAYPWVLALVPALLGGGAGTILLMSVLTPFPMPTQRGGNPFAASGQVGFANIGTRLVLCLLQLVPAVPVAVLLLLGSLDVLPWALWLALPVGVLGGVVTAWWWGRIAYRRLEAQGPELLAAVHTAD
jgi:ABC-2 type transport system permease protein